MCRGIVKHQDVGFGEVEIAQPRQGYATCLVASMGDALVRYAWKWLNVVLLVLILLLCQVWVFAYVYVKTTVAVHDMMHAYWMWYEIGIRMYIYYIIFGIINIAIVIIIIYIYFIYCISNFIMYYCYISHTFFPSTWWFMDQFHQLYDKTSVEFSPSPTHSWFTWKWDMNRTWKVSFRKPVSWILSLFLKGTQFSSRKT